MILLVDAHVLVWALMEPDAIARTTRQTLEDPANDVLVSSASAWELSIKRANGKIRLPASLAEAVEAVGFMSVPITLDDAERAAELPPHHKDPFDRMLVAQAQRLGAIVVTRDRAFADYEVDVLIA